MKKPVMVIPTYWRREKSEGIKKTDLIYDHPTPLDENGTLKRAIESTKVLKDKDFLLVIIAVANAEDIEQRVEEKVVKIISSSDVEVPVFFFSHSHLRKLLLALEEIIGQNLLYLLSLKGYSNIRNMCLFLTHILDSEIAILIDDDEVFEDPDFIRKAQEFIGSRIDSDFVGAVAGYYMQPDGGWKLKTKQEEWAKYWNTTEKMNEAFELFIGRGPRLKVTPFAFGGNMVIHREVFLKIPFDPNITRGEDIDFLINMRMFNYKCYLDNELYIRHLPPPKPHPIWKQMRQDIYRFLYEREKLRKQKKIDGMYYLRPEELDPYPGEFLKDNLEEKIYKATHALAQYYKEKGLHQDAQEALKNIEIANKFEWMKKDPFLQLLHLKNDWEALMKKTDNTDVRYRLKEFIPQIR